MVRSFPILAFVFSIGFKAVAFKNLDSPAADDGS